MQYWVEVMVYSAVRRGQEGRHQNSLFYTDDGMIASSDPGWLQGSFSTLVGMFDRVGMNTNVGKMVGRVFRLCQSAGTQLEAAYERQIMGAGPSYWERQCVRVKCSECREDIALGSLEVHLQTQHGKAAGGRRN